MWPSWLWVRHAYKLLHSTKFLHKFGMVEFVVNCLIVLLIFPLLIFLVSFSDPVPGDDVPCSVLVLAELGGH